MSVDVLDASALVIWGSLMLSVSDVTLRIFRARNEILEEGGGGFRVIAVVVGD